MSVLAALVAQLLHLGLVPLAAPLLTGSIDWMRARLAGHAGPPVLLPWTNMRRSLRKQPIVALGSSPVFAQAPVVSFAALLVALALVPSFALGMALAPVGDIVVVAGLLALSRTALALAALDTGTAAGGLAASRAARLACLAEPALLLVALILALLAGSSNLDLMAAMQQENGPGWRAGSGLALAALVLVALADAGRGPYRAASRPGAEFSAGDLALVEAAGALRLLVWCNLVGALLLPFGMAQVDAAPGAWLFGLVCWATKLLLFGVTLAAVEAIAATPRRVRAADAIGLAIVLALLAAVFLFANVGTA